MARQKNEKAVEAERLYKEEKKRLVEIAALIDISPGTVRRWKHNYNWMEKQAKIVNVIPNVRIKRKRTFAKGKPSKR